MPERLIVVGGDAAGMSAASQARRRRTSDDLEILVFERSSYVSYSACGEPYYVGGYITDISQLQARPPAEFAAMDITVHTVEGIWAAGDCAETLPPFAPVWDPVLIAARKAWESSRASE